MRFLARAFVVGVAIAVLAGAAQAGPFHYYGITPELSHHTPDAGPATDDVAWRVRLPDSRGIIAAPLVMNGSVYVLGSSGPFTMAGSEDRIHRLDRETGAAEPFAELDQMAMTWASDGSRVYVPGAEDVSVVDLATGDVVDRWAYPRLPGAAYERTICTVSLVSEGSLYVWCVSAYNAVPGAGDAYRSGFGRPYSDFYRTIGDATSGFTFAAAYDTATGERRWEWLSEGTSALAGPQAGSLPRASLTAPLFPLLPAGIAVAEDLVIVGGSYVLSKWRDATTRSDLESECVIAILDRNTGELRARLSSSDPAYYQRYREHVADPDPRTCGIAGEPTAHLATRTLYARFQGPFSARLEGDYGYVRIESFQDTDHETGAGFATDGTHLYASNWKKLMRYNRELALEGNPYTVADHPDGFGSIAPILAGDMLYAFAHHDTQPWEAHMAVHAIRVGGEDMERAWRYELPNDEEAFLGFSYVPSVSDGLLVLAGVNGEVIAFGATSGSPVPVARIADAYPPLDVPLEIDLSESAPGAAGPSTAYRVEWGDGEVSDWQAEPVLSHRYRSAATVSSPYTIRAQVRNDAGQTASAFVPVWPGVAPPDEAGTFGAMWARPALVAGGASLLLLLIPLAILAWRRRAALATAAERFEIVQELGRGSAGVALLARDRRLGRLVVLKRAHGSVGVAQAERRRLLREAQNAARVQHPNVVAVHEFLADEDPPILVMEYAPGGGLDRLLAEGGPIPTERALALALDMLGGLAAVHAAGIVHRDLKPSNVLLDAAGRAKVADFGIAVTEASPDATMEWGAAVGTPAYLAPEQVRGGPATERSDQYAAAAILYQLLTGRHHADGLDWSVEAVRQRIVSTAPDLDDPAIPTALRPILARALAKDPMERFPDVAGLIAALRASLAGDLA